MAIFLLAAVRITAYFLHEMQHTQNNARNSTRPQGIVSSFRSLLAGVLVLFLSASVPAHATLLINDSFSDGDRLSQNLPGSAHWYSGGPNSNVSVTNGMLAFANSAGGKATAMSYFNPTDLQVGQSLTLSFDYSFSQVANGDNSFMFGVYNSGDAHVTGDNINFNNAVFNNYTGYATSGVFGPDPSGPGRDHIEARDLTGRNLLSIGTYTEGTEYLQSGAATPGEIYTASMQIARTASGIVVESKIGNNTIVQKYSSEMFTKFDSVGIFANGNAGTFYLGNVTLDYTGAPEPSSFFAMFLFGMAVFGKPLLRKAKSHSLKSAWRRFCPFSQPTPA